MSKHEDKPAWAFCNYCEDLEISSIQKFMTHLREKHCTKEGGSYICQYGENNVCCSLPLEGVSDADYERHVYKHHTTSMPFTGVSRKISSSSTSSDKQPYPNHKWTQYCTAQNLPAVLNDPNKGKQKDFFTKTWGDSFTEVANISDPHYLPHITIHHFEHYLKRIVKKHKRRLKLFANIPKPHSHADLLQTFPSLRVNQITEKNTIDISAVPKIFLQPNFDLSNLDTFNAVFTHTVTTGGESSASNSAKLLQEKLTHYLDMVEVQIAQQVAQKSDAFFDAMTSHDVLMEQLGHTISVVRSLREKIQKVDKGFVKDSLFIIKSERTRSNYQQVVNKLKVMQTVMQTQPTRHLMLKEADYIGAIDLIQTTKDILRPDLDGINSVRHLSSELEETEKMINSLMKNEFERHACLYLNRSFADSHPDKSIGEKLMGIVMGMLRNRNFEFIEMSYKEFQTAIKAAAKMAAIKVVNEADYPEDLDLDSQVKLLSVEEWLMLFSNTTTVLLQLLGRVREIYDFMMQATDISSGKLPNDTETDLILSETADWRLSEKDHESLKRMLNSHLVKVCEQSQDICANLISSRSINGREKYDDKSDWLAEVATLTQLKRLQFVINKTGKNWEALCPDGKHRDLISAPFIYQANKYINKFHKDSMEKIKLVLDSEPWKKTDVPITFQELIDLIAEKGKTKLDFFIQLKIIGVFSINKSKESIKVKPYLQVENEDYAVVGTVFILVNIIAEYCVLAEEITICAETLLRHLRTLLTHFSKNCYDLILRGKAVSRKTGLEKITSTNLVLALRALNLIAWLIPRVKLHFDDLTEQTRDNLDEVTKNVDAVSQDIWEKILEIIKSLISDQLKSWAGKPPVPSNSFKNICRQLKKLHEAINEVLPKDKIQRLFYEINKSFIKVFREKLQEMKIVNDGGVVHGLVTTELIFYLEDLKKVKALPPESLEISSMNDIWNKE